MDLAGERRRLISLSTAKTLLPSNKRAHPLYRSAAFAARKHVAVRRRPLRMPSVPHHTGSRNFVFDALANGRLIKCLNVAVDCTKNAVESAGG
ncbi:MAG: hypothetical protein SVO96_00700 [Pseudomonadota bacterium]|nr:hypothetical protein [Pseudomonadota bacterium]